MMKVSFILLDWHVRESFHVLEYLNQQSITRDQYEIIWIEYYERKWWHHPKYAPDQYVTMNRPRAETYHKHKMYNLGLQMALGDIVCILDSDAVLTCNFVREIISSTRPGVVLHLDEVRNHNKAYYPFCYPTTDQLKAKPSNWTGFTTRGMESTEDMIHRRNYGACMAAWKTDLIRIGGADEHEDYRGYICGPYDMTFRLRNAGVKEVWHPGEFVYHAWHPHQDGAGILREFGPHDGRHMSTRALMNLNNGRVLPWVENEDIKQCRLSLQKIKIG